MQPWGETEESRKRNQFPPNDSLGAQIINLTITLLALIGLVVVMGLLYKFLEAQLI